MEENTKKAMNLVGIIVFGGWLLTALIEGVNGKYTSSYLYEFLGFIVGCAVIYYGVVYVLSKKQNENAKSTSDYKAS